VLSGISGQYFTISNIYTFPAAPWLLIEALNNFAQFGSFCIEIVLGLNELVGKHESLSDPFCDIWYI
jgi:hypothetical protein